jgi:transcriptional regulator with XRE-family HTH domain
MGRRKLTQDKVEYGKALSKVLVELRIGAGLSQVDVATEWGTSRQQVHNVERRSNLGAYELRNYAKFLGITPGELFEKVEQSSKESS